MSKSAHGHPSSYQAPNASLKTENDIERRIQALVAKDGIRVQEFFIDFDKLRKGTCGDAAFRTCLGTLKINLSQPEISELINRYKLKDGTGMINYASFIKNIN